MNEIKFQINWNFYTMILMMKKKQEKNTSNVKPFSRIQQNIVANTAEKCTEANIIEMIK